jgi:hypothetical protein
VVSFIERDHANVSFCSNHILGTAPPSFGGWPSAKRPRDLRFCTPTPGAVAPPTRRFRRLWGSATPRPSAGVQDRQVDGSSVRAPSSPPFSPPACLLQRRPSSPSVSDAGIHSRSSTALTGCFGPDRSPSECSPGLRSSPSAPRHEVPGFGGRLLVRPARILDRSAGAAAGLRSSARADRRVARLPSPWEPARGEPVDRRDVCCCRADPERSESPFTPHRVPARCLRPRRGRDRRGRENVESWQGRETGWGPWPQAGSFGPWSMASQRCASRRGVRRESHQLSERCARSWLEVCAGRYGDVAQLVEHLFCN